MMLNPGIAVNVMKQQQRRRQQADAERAAHAVQDSPKDGARARVRAYAFGDHKVAGAGVLTVVPNDRQVDLNIVKGMLLRSVYGDDVAFDRVDWTTVQILLLPDGEEVKSADLLCRDDKVVVYIGASPFAGDLHDKAIVEAHMIYPGFGPPRSSDDESDRLHEAGSSRNSIDFQPDHTSSVSGAGDSASFANLKEGSFFSGSVPQLVDGGGSRVSVQGQAHDRGGSKLSSTRNPALRPVGAQAQLHGSDSPDDRLRAGASAQVEGTSYVGLSDSQSTMNADRASASNGDGEPHELLPRPERGRRYSAPDAMEFGVQRAVSAAHEAIPSSRSVSVLRGRSSSVTFPQTDHLNIRSASVPPILASSSLSPASVSDTDAPPTPEALIASKAEALLARLEMLEARARQATGEKTAPKAGQKAKFDPSGRRLSLVANQKLRRAVHKLVLINRFNKNPFMLPPASASKTSIQTNNSGGSTATGIRFGLTSKKSRWGFTGGSRSKTIGKVMDQYVKEQSNLYEYNAIRKHSVQDDERLPWYIFRPDASWRVCWDMVMLGLVLYYSLLVPVRIGFDLHLNTDEKNFDYFSDVFFILDITLSFMTTYKEDGLFVANRHKIAVNYAKTWFFMDILASIPINWFTEAAAPTDEESDSSGGVNKMLRMLRLFKLFRLLRLLKLFPKLMMVIETTVRIDPAILRFLRSFLMLLLMWHLMGSAYWFVVRIEYNGTIDCPPIPGRPTRVCFVNHCLCDVDLTRDVTRVSIVNGTDQSWWDPHNPDIWVPHPAYANMPIEQQYWRAVVWAVAATTSIGENIVPRSILEHAFSTVMILLGLMMYSMIIGSASSALANLDTEAAEQKQMLDRIIAYMRQRKVPMFFQKIIKDYYQHWWSIPQHNEGVLNDLPAALRSKLNLILNRDLIERFPVLQHMNIDTYLRVVTRLTYATYLPGDYIVKQGESGDHMYLIRSGKVDAVLPNGVTVIMTLRPGDFFGEHSLLYLTRRDTSFRAVDFVDVLMLSRPDFTELYISAPEFVREVQRVDAERQAKRLQMELQVVKKPKKSDASPSGSGVHDDPASASSNSISAESHVATRGAHGSSGSTARVALKSAARMFSDRLLKGVGKVKSSGRSSVEPEPPDEIAEAEASGVSSSVKIVVDSAADSSSANSLGRRPSHSRTLDHSKRTGSAIGGLAGFFGGHGKSAVKKQGDMNLAALDLLPSTPAKGKNGKSRSKPQHPYAWPSTHDSSDDSSDDGVLDDGLKTVLPMQPHEVINADVPAVLGVASKGRRKSLSGIKDKMLTMDRARAVQDMRPSSSDVQNTNGALSTRTANDDSSSTKHNFMSDRAAVSKAASHSEILPPLQMRRGTSLAHDPDDTGGSQFQQLPMRRGTSLAYDSSAAAPLQALHPSEGQPRKGPSVDLSSRLVRPEGVATSFPAPSPAHSVAHGAAAPRQIFNPTSTGLASPRALGTVLSPTAPGLVSPRALGAQRGFPAVQTGVASRSTLQMAGQISTDYPQAQIDMPLLQPLSPTPAGLGSAMAGIRQVPRDSLGFSPGVSSQPAYLLTLTESPDSAFGDRGSLPAASDTAARDLAAASHPALAPAPPPTASRGLRTGGGAPASASDHDGLPLHAFAPPSSSSGTRPGSSAASGSAGTPAWKPGGAATKRQASLQRGFARQASLDRPQAGRIFRPSQPTSPQPGAADHSGDDHASSSHAHAEADLSTTVDRLLSSLGAAAVDEGGIDTGSLDQLARSAGHT